VQQADAVADDEVLAADLRRLAAALAPDEVQLFYQIALHGRNDLHLAPDEYAGFTMTLLRMLAFAPGAEAQAAPRAAPLVAVRPVARTVAPAPVRGAAAPSAPSPPRPTAARAPAELLPAAGASAAFDGNWPALVARLKVAGLVKELAQRSELVSVDGQHLRLRVPLKTLLEAGAIDKLRAAIEAALGHAVRISAEVGATAGPTAAGLAATASAERQRQAEESIYGDPFVRELIEHFGASVDPASIRPRDTNDTGPAK
jgi:DNA polymerase-3 subunit gamma/tau